jgi:hypothetical protein
MRKYRYRVTVSLSAYIGGSLSLSSENKSHLAFKKKDAVLQNLDKRRNIVNSNKDFYITEKSDIPVTFETGINFS